MADSIHDKIWPNDVETASGSLSRDECLYLWTMSGCRHMKKALREALADKIKIEKLSDRFLRMGSEVTIGGYFLKAEAHPGFSLELATEEVVSDFVSGLKKIWEKSIEDVFKYIETHRADMKQKELSSGSGQNHHHRR